MSLRQQNSHNIVRLCRSQIFLRLTRLKNPKSSGKRRTMSKVTSRTGQHRGSKRKYSIGGTRQVYESGIEAEARARTGRNPIGLNCTDANKGRPRAPRHRLRPGLYVSAPQRRRTDLLSNTTLGSSCEFCFVLRVRRTFAGVSRAHFYADVVRNFRLLDEDPKSQSSYAHVENSERRCTDPWMLLKRWREHCAQVFEAGGFYPRPGITVPSHPQGLGHLLPGAR